MYRFYADVIRGKGSGPFLTANKGVNQLVTSLGPQKGPKEQSFEPFLYGVKRI